MSRVKIFLFIVFAILCFATPINVFAEDILPSGVIPKLQKTADDPKLINGKVYPFWGPVCQRYTYSVIYQDEKNRPPEYIKIYFNGKMIDLEKEDQSASDYKKGVKYFYKNVPNKFGSNFYYFEASNGKGKARASIIDSPDNGPVLFDSDFKHNEIVLIDSSSGKEAWRFSTGDEWVGAVALSDNGKYLTAQTSNHIYFFDTNNNKPVWEYKSSMSGTIGGDVKGGVAISGDGSKIFGALNGRAIMFNNSSNKPVWTYNLEQNGGGAYGVDMAKDGQSMAVAMAGTESDENTNVLLLFDSNGKKLWQYHALGNWHEVNFSDDGKYIAGATGCPDRRGYLFSVDSAEPIIKSEPLSKESPIDEASISADGSQIAYGVESAYGAVVLVDKNTKQTVWKYETAQGKSVRALAMTPNGNYIGAGTFGGDILIFDNNSNQPVEQLKINSAIGAFDISDDGSVFATGSADKKIRIFEKGVDKAKAEIELGEYIGELDISANGKFVAGGTSGSVYFFETIMDLNNVTTSACSDVIEPPKEDTSMFGGQNGGNRVEDSSGKKVNPNIVFYTPVIISAVSAGAIFILFLIYLIYCHKRHLSRKIIFVILAISLIVISLATAFYFWKTQKTVSAPTTVENVSSDENNETKTTDDATTLPTTQTTDSQSSGGQNVIKTEGDSSGVQTTTNTVENTTKSKSSGAGVCGNGICEPGLGESQSICPRDCSGGN